MFGYRSRSMPLLQQPTPLAYRSLSPRGRPERRRTGARHFYIDGARTAIIGADAYPNPHRSPQRLILCGADGGSYKMTRSSSTAELSRSGVFRSMEDLRDSSRDSSRTRAVSCEDVCRAACGHPTSSPSPTCAWDSRLSESGVSLNDSRTDLGSSCAGLEDMDGASQCSFGSSLAFHEMTADSELDRADSDYVSAPSSTCDQWQGVVGRKKARHDSGSREKFLSELNTSGSGRSSPTEDLKEFYHSTPTKRRSPVLSIFPADAEDLHFPSKEPPPLPLTSPPHSPLPQDGDDPNVQRFTEIIDEFNTSSASGATTATHHNSRLRLFPFAKEYLELEEEEAEEYNEQPLLSCTPGLSHGTKTTTNTNTTTTNPAAEETNDEGLSSSPNPCLFQPQPYQTQPPPSSASPASQHGPGMSVKDRVRQIEQDPRSFRPVDTDHDSQSAHHRHQTTRRPHASWNSEIGHGEVTLKSGDGKIGGAEEGRSSFFSPPPPSSPPSLSRKQHVHLLRTSCDGARSTTTTTTPGAGSINTVDEGAREALTSLLANGGRRGHVRERNESEEEEEEAAAIRQEKYGTRCHDTQTGGGFLNKSGEGEDWVGTTSLPHHHHHHHHHQLPLVNPSGVATICGDVDSTAGAGVNTITTTTTTTTAVATGTSSQPQSANSHWVKETSLTPNTDHDTSFDEGGPNSAENTGVEATDDAGGTSGIFAARERNSSLALSSANEKSADKGDPLEADTDTETDGLTSQDLLLSAMAGHQKAAPSVTIREVSRRHTHHVERTKVKEMVKTERTVVRHAAAGSAKGGEVCDQADKVKVTDNSAVKRTTVREEEKVATTTITTTTTSAPPSKTKTLSAERRLQATDQAHLSAGDGTAAPKTVQKLKMQLISLSANLVRDNDPPVSGSCTSLNRVKEHVFAPFVEGGVHSGTDQPCSSEQRSGYTRHHPESFIPSAEMKGPRSTEEDTLRMKGLTSVSITLRRSSSQQKDEDSESLTSNTENRQRSSQRSENLPWHKHRSLVERSKYDDMAEDGSDVLSASFDDILSFDEVADDKSEAAVPEITLWDADNSMTKLSKSNEGRKAEEVLTRSQNVPTASGVPFRRETSDIPSTKDNSKLAASLHSRYPNADNSVASKARKTRKGVDPFRAAESDPTDYLHSKQLVSSLKHSKKSPWVVETVDHFQNILNDFVNQDSTMQKSIVHDMLHIDTGHHADESELDKQMEVCEDLYRSFTREFLEKRQNHVCPFLEDNMPVFRFKRYLRKKHNSKLKGHKTFRIRHHLDRLSESSMTPEGALLSTSEPCLAKSRLSVHHPHHRVSSGRPRGRLVSDVFADDLDVTRSTDSAYSSLCCSLSPHSAHLDSGFHSMTSSRADVSSVATDLSLDGDALTSPCDVYEHLDLSDVGIDEALLDRLRACHYRATTV